MCSPGPAWHQPRGPARRAVREYRKGQLTPRSEGALVDLQLSGHQEQHPLGALPRADDHHLPLLEPDEVGVAQEVVQLLFRKRDQEVHPREAPLYLHYVQPCASGAHVTSV
jgi:hypothetical protein